MDVTDTDTHRVNGRGFRFGTKVGQIGHKWEKSWDFLISVSIHFVSPSQNVLKLILKSPKFLSLLCLISPNLDAKFDNRGVTAFHVSVSVTWID